MEMEQRLRDICRSFRIQGSYVESELIPVGNVNKTYKVTYRREEGTLKSYIVQQVNTFVFRKPEQVMHNIDLVTEHIRAKSTEGIPLHFHHTADRKTYIYADDAFWRLYNYIPSVTYNTCENTEVLQHAGEAFGRFQKNLADFNAEQLYETIPNFHNTPERLRTLFEDAEKDPLGLAGSVREELSYIRSVSSQACEMARMQRDGRLPIRVTHNDTKINNVLFDRNTNRALTIIDLDTVMPGLVGHDFGDAIRFGANYVAEDSREYEKAGCNMELFSAFTRGFLSQTRDTLTEDEIRTLPLSVFTLAVELASRFLDDYLLGNVYFRTEYPEHNLVRTRCQLNMARDVMKKMGEMERIIRECVQGWSLGRRKTVSAK